MSIYAAVEGYARKFHEYDEEDLLDFFHSYLATGQIVQLMDEETAQELIENGTLTLIEVE